MTEADVAEIPFFNESDMERSLEERFLRRGWNYYRQDKVVSVEKGNEGLLVGRVKGSGRTIYSVLATVREKPYGLAVGGRCSCPVAVNCKHVAAVLYHHMENRRATIPVGTGEARLSTGASRWLEGVRKAAEAASRPPGDERILYLISLTPTSDGVALGLEPVVSRPLKSGGNGVSRRLSPERFSATHLLTEEDHLLFRLLDAPHLRVRGPGSPIMIQGAASRRLLMSLIATGRCHWGDKDSPALRWGEPLASALEWQEGDVRRIVLASDERMLPLPTLPPSYYDPSSGCCGPLVSGLPDELTAALAAAPEITTDEAAAVSDALVHTAPSVPRPDGVERVVRDDVGPIPCLFLFSENLAPPGIGVEDWVECGQLHFDYDGHAAHPFDEGPVTVRGEGRVELIQRRFVDEERGLERLASVGLLAEAFSAEGEAVELVPMDGRETLAWITLMVDLLPELEAEGWRITIDPSFRMAMKEVSAWYGEVEEAPSGGWFDLELGIEVDGKRVSLLPLLAAQLADAKGVEQFRALDDEGFMLLPLDGGGVVRLPVSRLRRLADVLVELYDHDTLDGDKLRLDRLQAPRLLELDEGEAIAWSGDRKLRQYGRKLARFKGIKAVKPPRGLSAELRPYQQEGLNWLQFLRQYELGGVLADDMGLGKTIQTLAHLLKEKETRRADRPSLVVGAASLMVNWRREAERFAPSLKVLTLHGPGRKALFDAIGDHDLVLTTYPLLARDRAALTAASWHLAVFDEAQHLKNPKAKAWAAARELEARHRIALTGTPMENHLGELWSIFDQLIPGFLGESRRFSKLFRTPIEKRGDHDRHEALRRRTAPFMLRREKNEVVTELPPKSEILSQVELDGGQRDLYEAIRVSMFKRVREEIEKRGLARSHITILDALLKLRQVCCDPRLLKVERAKKVKESAKLAQLMEMLPEMVEEGRRILLFSQFTSMLGLIEKELKRHKIAYVKLTGQTRDRATPVDRFQAGEVPIFLISLKAGGSGLNLTAADTVIHYDPWWNPAVERQATDRAHRIGQEKPVFVYKLIAQGTVEERIAEMQARKQGLADALFAEGGKGAAALTGEELQALFEPLT